MSAEPALEIVEFGTWGAAGLLAEYDAESDTIRVNARIVARLQAECGAPEAARFIACAVAHERFHRAVPAASEAHAHAHVRTVTGSDPQRFERFARERAPGDR